MKKYYVRDVSIGALLLTIALYVIYLTMYLSGFPNIAVALGIIFTVLLARKLILLGYRLITGIEITIDKNDKK